MGYQESVPAGNEVDKQATEKEGPLYLLTGEKAELSVGWVGVREKIPE